MEEIKEDCSSKPVCIIALGMAGAGKTALIKVLKKRISKISRD
jgi:GTPase SAR1 family protein